MRSEDFDNFVSKRVTAAQIEIVEKLRQFFEKYAPDAHEAVSYGVPLWKTKHRQLAVLNRDNNAITLSFSHATKFMDDFGLLENTSHNAKVIKFFTVKNINEAALSEYIGQELRYDQ